MLMNNITTPYVNPYSMLNKVKQLLIDFKVTVRVPRIALYDENELKIMGMPTTRVNDDTKTDVTNMDTVMLSVYKLLDIVDNGFGVRITNPEMIPKITELLEEALEGLKYSVEETELKEKIKNFMEKILDVNRDYIEQKYLEQVEDIGEGLFDDINKVAPKIDISKLEV